MSKAADDGAFEIALVGDFQSGKSTTFNALLGRSLSPCGIGLKTSACAVTARALGQGESAEYAEPVWRTRKWLDAIVREVERGDSSGRDAPWRESQDVRRAAALIKRFSRSPELAALRKQSSIEVGKAQKWLSYPADWEERWMNDPFGNGFTLSEVLPFFLERVVFHIKASGTLAFLSCDLTDAPGFETGAWDALLSRETMLRANVLVCVLNGRHKTIDGYGPFMEELTWFLNTGHADKMLFAQNGEGMENEAAIARTNAAILRQRGFSLSNAEPITFDGQAAMIARSPDDIGESRIIDLFAGFKKLTERVKYNALNVKIRLESGGFPEPSPGYGWDSDMTDNPFGLFESVKWISGMPHPVYAGLLAADGEGNWMPSPGYEWVETKNNLCVKWRCGVSHPSFAHIHSCDSKGTWEPDKGYVWILTRSTDSKTTDDLTKVVWCPGLKDPGRAHFRAAQKEGDWVKAEKRDKDEILSLAREFPSLLRFDRFFVGDKIPLGKRLNARRSMNVPNYSDIIVLYDDTVWGGSREGFLITATGVFAKSFLEEPHFWKWNDIRVVKCASGFMWINDTTVNMPTLNDEVAPHIAEFIKGLAK